MKFKKEKVKELVLYICIQAGEEKLNYIKLNKTLWKADQLAYVIMGEPITGETYIKQSFGPMANHLLSVLDELINEEKLSVRETSVGLTYSALIDADLRNITDGELDIIDDTIEVVCDNTSEPINNHDIIWQVADLGEKIPYPAAFASYSKEVTSKEIELAKERLEKILL